MLKILTVNQRKLATYLLLLFRCRHYSRVEGGDPSAGWMDGRTDATHPVQCGLPIFLLVASLHPCHTFPLPSFRSHSRCSCNIMVDLSEYKVGVVLSVEDSAGGTKKGGKPLRVCSIDIAASGSSGGEPLAVVTSAPNVREGSRVAVAPVGSTVVTDDGSELKITKTAVGGVMSEGMLCDSQMLGWTGGAAGIAVQIPDSIPIGSAPPATKPRPTNGSAPAAAAAGEEAPSGPVTEGLLFERKLTKEEKKKLAAEKRAAKKAAKEAKDS